MSGPYVETEKTLILSMVSSMVRIGRTGILAVAVGVFLLAGSVASAGAQDTSNDGVSRSAVEVRDRLIAAQEALLNVYRCMFNIDTQVVEGGCANGTPRLERPEPTPFAGVATQSDVDVRNELIAAQESLLNVYRCMFNIDAEVVPGGCEEGRPNKRAPVAVSPRPSGCDATMPGTKVDYAVFSPASSLDPTANPGSVVGGTELVNVWDVLMTFDSETGDYQPRVAKSLTPNLEFTEWTLVVPSGITYGNGDAFVAQDVIDSMRRFLEGRSRGATNSSAADLLLVDFTNTEAVDDNTVVFRLTRPWATFPLVLADEPGMIVNPRVVARLMAEEADNADEQNSVERLVRNRLSASPGLVNAASFGPYEVAAVKPGELIRLQARSDYWGGPVCIEEIEFTFPGYARANWNGFKSGAFNAAFLRDEPLIEEARRAGAVLNTEVINAGGVFLINHGVRGRDTIGQDLRIRQAIHHAIDRELINARAFGGKATVTNALAHEGTLMWSPELQECADRSPVYDPDAAAALVQEVKDETGWDGSLFVVTTDQDPNPSISHTIADLLEQVGFDVVVEMGSITNVLIPRVIVQADYEVALWGHAMDGATWLPKLIGSYHSEGTTNRGAYSHPTMDVLLDYFYSAATLDEQRAALAAVQCVWSEQLPSMVWSAPKEGLVLAPNIKGVLRTHSSVFLFGGAYIQN